MGLMKKGTPTGVQDQFLRDICVGDEIADEKGKHYTINAYGYAKPLSGGTEIPLKSVKGKTVTTAWKPAESAPFPFGQPGVKEPPIPDPEFDPAPPHPDEIEAAKKSGTKSEPVPVTGVVSPRGGRTNRSGVTSFWNLSRSLGFTAARLKEIAQENGFEIVRTQGANRNTGIRIEEVERFRALLPEQDKKERKSRSVTKEPEKVFIQEDPATAPEPEKVLPPFDENPLAGYTDQSLADELRRRGFELHAVKRIEL